MSEDEYSHDAMINAMSAAATSAQAKLLTMSSFELSASTLPTTNGSQPDDTTNGSQPDDTTNGSQPDDTTNGGQPDDTTNGGQPDDTWLEIDAAKCPSSGECERILFLCNVRTIIARFW